MKKIITDKYPIRYVAFDNPKVWVESEKIINSGGCGLVVYHEPVKNFYYPSLEDGIYIQISSYRGYDFIVECHLTLPIHSRIQHNETKLFKTFQEAKNFALEWIPQAQQKIKKVIMERELVIN